MEDRPEKAYLLESILNIKDRLGEQLVILTHHYQRKEIIDLGDFRGDSFALSQKAATHEMARYIVFCGVHFMAESAAVLAQPHQTVQIPMVEAGCWMADMADISIVQQAWNELISLVGAEGIMPVVYMNSDAMLKALCGREGGTVCTSSNAPAAFRWAIQQRGKLFFFPDQYLGHNTANALGITGEEIIIWKPGKPMGGSTAAAVKKARVVLWDGYCLVHTRFRVDHIRRMRERFANIKIVVHPECTEKVVAGSDAVGSTSFIVKYVTEAPSGSTIGIGTEINLIERLALDFPDKTIVALSHSLCPNMYKINLENVLRTLENVGQINVVTVADQVKRDARMAMDRMLALPPT